MLDLLGRENKIDVGDRLGASDNGNRRDQVGRYGGGMGSTSRNDWSWERGIPGTMWKPSEMETPVNL